MKLTIELDPTADRALFDRVMAAVMDHPARVTMEAAAPSTPDEKSDDPTPDEKSGEPVFRAYGEPSPGKKRRNKDETAEDAEIDRLSDATGLAIRTDIPAADLLAEMQEAEDIPDEKSEEPEDTPDEKSEGFNLDESDEPVSMEEFRARVVKVNQKHGQAAIKILSQYGSGLTKIPEEKRNEVLAKLEALDA